MQYNVLQTRLKTGDHKEMTGARRKASPKEQREASEELTEVLRTIEPACAGDERFTEARPRPITAKERKALYKICFECPIFDECSRYAQATVPAAGFWAGKNYGTWERPERSSGKRNK